jgi:hypothetical protein
MAGDSGFEKALRVAYGLAAANGAPKIRIDRVRVRDGLWIKEGVNDYELKDGRIWRDTRYYSQPFEAPEWRAQWVEKL